MYKKLFFLILFMIYGFLLFVNAQIIIDPETKKIYITTGYLQNTGLDIDAIFVEETVLSTDIDEDYLNDDIQFSGGLTELEESIIWMHANGLTKYNNIQDYRPNDLLTREESAKIIGQLYIKLGYEQSVQTIECSFLDSSLMDPSLSDYIDKVCKRRLFKGDNGMFLPNQPLTKPQAIAVLIRMFQGGLSDETKNPWWNDYFLKAQKMGIIDNESFGDYDRPITREEIALYVYRLKNIASNEKLSTMAKNAINQIDTASQMKGNINLDNLSALSDSISSSKDPELQEAVKWMFDNGITSFSTVEEYKPFDILLREQGAKMIHMFAQLYGLDKSYNNFIGDECIFKDNSKISAVLSLHVNAVCKLGLMKGNNGNFEPQNSMLKSDFVVSLVRMLEQKSLDETLQPWWTNYFQKAQELGIIGPADIITFENPITRYEVALFLYRFKVKYQMMSNLNTNKIQNEVISTVPNSTVVGANSLLEANVYIDINVLNKGDFALGYIELFGERYKIIKTSIEKYRDNNYVWYGELFDIVTNNEIGTISFIMSNGSLLESTVRISYEEGTKNYLIIGDYNTALFYKIKEISR